MRKKLQRISNNLKLSRFGTLICYCISADVSLSGEILTPSIDNCSKNSLLLDNPDLAQLTSLKKRVPTEKDKILFRESVYFSGHTQAYKSLMENVGVKKFLQNGLNKAQSDALLSYLTNNYKLYMLDLTDKTTNTYDLNNYLCTNVLMKVLQSFDSELFENMITKTEISTSCPIKTVTDDCDFNADQSCMKSFNLISCYLKDHIEPDTSFNKEFQNLYGKLLSTVKPQHKDYILGFPKLIRAPGFGFEGFIGHLRDLQSTSLFTRSIRTNELGEFNKNSEQNIVLKLPKSVPIPILPETATLSWRIYVKARDFIMSHSSMDSDREAYIEFIQKSDSTGVITFFEKLLNLFINPTDTQRGLPVEIHSGVNSNFFSSRPGLYFSFKNAEMESYASQYINTEEFMRIFYGQLFKYSFNPPVTSQNLIERCINVLLKEAGLSTLNSEGHFRQTYTVRT